MEKTKKDFSQVIEENLKKNMLNNNVYCLNLQGIIGYKIYYACQIV